MRRYRKKPVVIEAVIWEGKPRPMFDFLTGTENETMVDRGRNFHIDFNVHSGVGGLGALVIHTLEGDMVANMGDYIIKGVNGEFYPCKPDIFCKTYEEVE
jgi:hypothetical protein